jgi:hypothetical protein
MEEINLNFKNSLTHRIVIDYKQNEEMGKIKISFQDKQNDIFSDYIIGLIDLSDNRKIKIIETSIYISNSELSYYEDMIYMIINSSVFNYFN